MDKVEISNGAYHLLLAQRSGECLADKIIDLFHDPVMQVPEIPADGITPEYLREIGKAVRAWAKLPSRNFGFRTEQDFLTALGAYWIGEFPYEHASFWRKSGIKTTVTRSQYGVPTLDITQQSLMTPAIYVPADNAVRMQLAERNWPSLLYLAARFTHCSDPSIDLHMDIRQFGGTHASELVEHGFELAKKQALAQGKDGKAVPLVEPRSMQIPYVHDGLLHFSVREMTPADWGGFGQKALNDFDCIRLEPAEGRSFFVACLYQSGMSAKMAHQIVRRATN